ncbi:hypothetical protein MGYG_06834 [Nannizzia gypsea CBS 118893]|uniref:Uncharacterized protein n=1 Tax=Arthroderma gypseum (strain ATCC MYA-4604 / CBS 118893) TaxID=535722 RepID=E4V1C0_ARTGP|nr:hypothetical protein MGYG_06834 [Nannizzia gypsea CBS 118893]EFR03835.1 hypothetical protein MGYG_06834 [Nannizzia gypsea CBS 118893]
MQLNLGITADAAAVHRHEYSASPETPQGASSAFFPSARSILSLGFASLTKQGSTAPSSSSNSESQTPTAQAANTYRSIVPSRSVVFQEPATMEEAAAHTESGSDSPDAGGTLDDSVDSVSKKNTHRSRTILRFAHPPPTTRHKRLLIRPRLLLQLQQVSNTTRPVSVLDVVPSSLFKGRAQRKLSGPFAARDRIYTSDLIVLPSDTYGPVGAGDEDQRLESDLSNESREPVATISQIRKDDSKSKANAEICLSDGLHWISEPLPNGGYEFTATDEHGIKKCVRWVARGKRNRSGSIQATGRQSPGPEGGKRLTFSIIDPLTRRHPIIGWLCRTGIEVLDQESLSSVYANRESDYRPGSPPTETTTRHSPVVIDDKIRQLITITGIWVAFQEGWAGNPLVTHNIESSSSNGISISQLPPSPAGASEHPPSAGVGEVQSDGLPTRTNSGHTTNKRSSLTSRIRQKGRRTTATHTRSSSIQKQSPRRSCSDDGVGKGSGPSTPTHARSCSMLCSASQESSPNYPHRPIQTIQDSTDPETPDEMNDHLHDNNPHSSPGQAPRHRSRQTSPAPVSGAGSPGRDRASTPDQSTTSSAGSKEKKGWRKFGGLLGAVRPKKGPKTLK